MTRAAGSYKDFLALSRQDGLSKTNKFEVLIVPPEGGSFQPSSIIQLKDVSLLAETSSLPEMNLTVERLNIYGPTYPRPTGIDYGDTITLSFYLDRALTIRDMFERWMHMAVDPLTFNVNYQKNYISKEISIRKLDSKDDVVREYMFEDCFPIKIGQTALSAGADDYSKMDVTFAYRKWTPYMYESTSKWTSRSIFSPLESLYGFVSDTISAGAGAISKGIGAIDDELNNIINGPVR